MVTETSSTRFDRLGGVTKLTDDFRTVPDLSPKTTHTKLQTNYGQTNDETGHQKMLSTMLTFLPRGRNGPTSMGLTAITIIIDIRIRFLHRDRFSNPFFRGARLTHGTMGIQRRKNLSIRLTKSRRQNVVNGSACKNRQDGRNCRKHRPRTRSHPRSSHRNSNSRRCIRLSY